MSRNFLLLLIILTVNSTLSAQNAVISSGNDAGSVSYTVGQVFVNTIYNTYNDIVVFQGVQQPYEIFFVTSLPTNTGELLGVQIYPNPTSDMLVLQINNFDDNKLKYELIDSKGIVLQSNAIDSPTININMSTYSNSLYFLRIIRDYQIINVIKIIKN